MVVVICLAGALAAGCGDARPGAGDSEEPTGAEESTGADEPTGADASGWRKVAQAPLSPREAPLMTTVGDRILVIGGSDAEPCPPAASCVMAPDPLRDGAAYDPATDTWTPIATAPKPISGGFDGFAVVGDTVYMLSLQYREDGTHEESFLAYDADADTWSTLALPLAADNAWVSLAAAGGRLLALRGHQRPDSTMRPLDPIPPDLVYEAESDTWTELPLDPLGPSFDRRVIGYGDRIVLLAKDLVPNPGAEPPVVRAARLDAGADTWTPLPDGDVLDGEGFHHVGDLVISADAGSGDGGKTNNWGRHIPAGGVLDPIEGVWSDLPDRPERDYHDFGIPGSVSGERTVVSGAWVLDAPTLTWSRVPDLPDDDYVQGRSVAFADTAKGGVVVLWGGARWPASANHGMGDGELVAEGWAWIVPPPE